MPTSELAIALADSDGLIARAAKSTTALRILVDIASGQCEGCLEVKTTYRISDHAARGNGDGEATRSPVRSATITQSEALWEFLTSRRGQMFCTQCIATALFATKRVDRAVLGAEGRGARRQYGTCASCGKERLLCGLMR